MDDADRLNATLSGRYRVERELGRGGMATVYLAADLRHERMVALKVLRPELAHSLGSDRFLREIRVTAQLEHPHILPLLDSGEADGLLYYAMPLVEGESLRDRLNRERQLSVGDAVSITREVADALDHAHRRGIVHRDIKPENIMLSAGHARVADFGIARAVASSGDALTEIGMSVGTPLYMSPEQAAAERDVDGRADIYSLGCVAYEMLTGHPPFTGSSAREILTRHAIDAVPGLAAARVVPEHVRIAIETALAKSPADRFATASELATALSRGPTRSRVASNVRAKSTLSRRRAVGAVIATVLLATIIIGIRSGRPGGGRPEPGLPSNAIAVLPFQNLSAEPTHAYFAGGLHDELITQLSKVVALNIISRTSVLGYQQERPHVREIARELGVGTVVEGSVQVIGNRLRVTVQLIDAERDSHLWAERYDRTMDDAFAIQSDIAQQVVNAVGAVLTKSERAVLAQSPTADPEAYRLYLAGRDYSTRPDRLRDDLDSAQFYFQRATSRDPRFALAHAALSELHGYFHLTRLDPSPERVELQRREAEAALRLAPALPEAHFAMGLYRYWGQRDLPGAAEAFRNVLRGNPSAASAWRVYGAIQRRQGEVQEAITAFERARQLSPLDAHLVLDVGNAYLWAGRYVDGIRAYEASARIEPRMESARLARAVASVLWEGRSDSLRAYLDRAPDETDFGAAGSKREWEIRLAFMERRPDEMLRLAGDPRGPIFVSEFGFIPPALYAAWAHQLKGDAVAARQAFRVAVEVLDTLVRRYPNQWPVRGARGQALAGLGRHVDALNEAEWLAQSPVYRDDAYEGGGVGEDRARILIALGQPGTALAEIERRAELGFVTFFSVTPLELDPRFDPIRDHPRFRALMARQSRARR